MKMWQEIFTRQVNDEGLDAQWTYGEKRRDEWPAHVVIGRMEYFLNRGADKETTCSLKAIMSQAQRLIELCQQLMDEARIARAVIGLDPPVSRSVVELPEA